MTQISPDTYRVGRKSAGGIFTDTAKLRDAVIREAEAFAAARGKVAVPVATHSARPIVGGVPSFEYEFKLVDKGAESAGATVPAKRNVAYDEIIKLGELRKNGLITDAEFESEKQKLLER